MGRNMGQMASARGLLSEERTSGTRALGAAVHWGRQTHSRILTAALMHIHSFIYSFAPQIAIKCVTRAECVGTKLPALPLLNSVQRERQVINKQTLQIST